MEDQWKHDRFIRNKLVILRDSFDGFLKFVTSSLKN